MQRYLLWSSRKFSFIPLALILLFLTFGFSAENIFAQAPDGAKLFQPCMACHQIGKGKLVGPDLQGVTKRIDRQWLRKFIRNSQEVVQSGDPEAVKIWEQFNKIPMPPFDYTDEQINAVLDYIENYNPEAAKAAPATVETPQNTEKTKDFFAEPKHNPRDYGTTFIISVVLILIALFDLFFSKLIKAKFVHLVVILISLAVITEITIVEAQALGRQQYYAPDQPIMFSHRIHAGQNQINCQYCHFTAEESKNAGYPPVNVCMNCHNVVKSGKNTGTTEINKIYKAVETGKPIEWIRVHNLPDHTFFSHAQHVKVGKVACETCHGDVKQMDRIEQVNSLGMGWCIECHRNHQVQFTENPFYKKYAKLQKQMETGQRSRVTVDDVGGTECGKCHY